MATDITTNAVADHVLFDRIVDADRTITLARNAAEKAEAAGNQEVADKLRAKADALEKILQATQHPEYDDDEEDLEQESGGDEDESNSSDSGQGSENDENNKDQTASGQNDENSQEENEPEKTPDDIAKMNDGNSGIQDHSGGTQHIGPEGGGSGSEGEGGSSGGGSGSGKGGKGKGSGNKKSKSKEFDPFKKSSWGQGSGGQQPTPEEILAAVINRLSGLEGNAKAGADKALKQLFDETGGMGEIDD